MSELIYPPLKGTALFRVTSKKRLAELLLTKLETLKKVADSDDQYNCWSEPKKNGGIRNIEAPYPHLKTIQKRIAILLQGIEPPEYLMAPVKSRSYVTNAAKHVGSRAFRLLDIEDFFPSCTAKKVYWFFNSCMECSEDVSGILAAITTRKGKLPQGSPCSPFLAFFAYIDMWQDISNICGTAKNTLTIYADDITVSGEVVLSENIWQIKQTLYRNGHRFNVEKERSTVNKSVEITGVIVSSSLLLLPNRQHKKLREAKTELSRASSRACQLKLGRIVRGRIAQATQILKHR
ncbi:MAG: reverse transcriptase family protein [Emcibacter sp.]|nr:reverse transcriptase family protein [Emcibacter sp.]